MGKKVLIVCTEGFNIFAGVKNGKGVDLENIIRGDCKDKMKGDCLNCNCVKLQLVE